MNDYNEISFEDLRLSGVKEEDTRKMDTSFFCDVYHQAKSIISSIVDCNKENDNLKSGLSKSETQNCINNVIAFIGRRGTGKTSAMLSIANYLAQGQSDIKEDTFYALPYTDVSVFEKNEDVFIITLSKMNAFLSDILDDNTIRFDSEKFEKVKKIKDKICTVYDHYVSFIGTDFYKLNSSYNLMEKVENRYNVHNEFAELVDEYIKLLNSYKSSKLTEGYLIICLDDIDMTKYNHLKIMQCIHQFFMIPNVIVMVTMRTPILSAAIKKEFFSSLHTVALDDENNLKLSREQQEDYIRKIIPSGMRITMPSWRKRDYQIINPIRIVFKLDAYAEIKGKFSKLNGSKLFSNYYYEIKHNKNNDQDKEYKISPKELIMIMLSDRTEIYLDANGKKYHFMEPDSLRNLYDLFYLMYNMGSIQNNDESDMRKSILKENRKIILDYLHFKMLPDGNFTNNIRLYIDSFLQDPIDRRGERIWNFYYTCLNKSNEQQRITSLFGDRFYFNEKGKYKIENYSMGEVYRLLYFSSRIGLADMDRNLVKFVLSSFSFALPEFIEKELEKINKKEFTYSESLLCNLFGYTLIGEWRKDIFNGSEVDITINCDKFAQLFAPKTDPNEIKEFVRHFLYLFLLTSTPISQIIEVNEKRYNFTRNDNKPIAYHFEINADPTSFIINTIDLDERIDHTKFKFGEGASCEGVVALLGAIFKDDRFKFKKAEFIIKQIVCEVKDNIKNKTKSLSFLLEQTDLSYNVIKRSIIKMLYTGSSNLKAKKQVANTPIEAIKEFYESMIYYLKKQDNIYFSGSFRNGFGDAFDSNPIVRYFLKGNNSNILSLGYSKNYEPSETLEYCLNILQDDSGPFYTDIQSFKQYYKDNLSMRVNAKLRRRIAILIESYRNSEMTIADVINEINKSLDISITESFDDNVTFSDCLSMLKTDDKYQRDIIQLSLQFHSFLNIKLNPAEVEPLLNAFRQYISDITNFEDLKRTCQEWVVTHSYL